MPLIVDSCWLSAHTCLGQPVVVAAVTSVVQALAIGVRLAHLLSESACLWMMPLYCWPTGILPLPTVVASQVFFLLLAAWHSKRCIHQAGPDWPLLGRVGFVADGCSVADST